MKPTRKKKVKKEKVVEYDYVDAYRGVMTVLKDTKSKKTLMLTEWPQSLLDAHRAGILTGQALNDALTLGAPSGTPQRYSEATHRPVEVGGDAGRLLG